MRGADVGRKTLPRLLQRLIIDARRESEAQVVAVVAVEMRELHRGFLVVEPEIGFLARTERAIYDRSDGPAGETHERHRDVLDFDGAVERGDHGLHFLPVTEQVK